MPPPPPPPLPPALSWVHLPVRFGSGRLPSGAARVQVQGPTWGVGPTGSSNRACLLGADRRLGVGFSCRKPGLVTGY
ncbi:unnamed protein product [Gulo gulo]|uniref:Uncharacterized protein n=1 Tax=Gulo gulo TaxID=48420 RepID=A0A9X9PYW3_GULGU|nr:unnamed protein product [Gulo gulo]